MTKRVYMEPNYDGSTPDRAEGGIRRVVEALHRYLPEHGFQFIPEQHRADLTVGHGVLAPRAPGVPFVTCCHGLHWSDYDWPAWAHQVNGEVTRALVQADAITVPSRWVGGAVRRGLLRRPVVIHHGVDADEWAGGENGGYVLWNKARADPVSDPRDMQKLAARMLDVPFRTTVGHATANVTVLGVQPLPAIRAAVQNAGVYLATARETFGIGTLEALAAGVPVAGWDYGGQREIIVPGETGYLAPFGDYAALDAAVRRCFAERERLSANAQADAAARWGWADKIAQYAALFDAVLAAQADAGPSVSVVVTCHNLARWLPEALDSLLAQTFHDWECLIVDDWSDDGTPDIAGRYSAADARFTSLRTPRNLGLSGARNFGAQNALGRYLLFLDADDCLAPEALGVLARSLDHAPDLHIAYGRLALLQENAPPKMNPWPDGPFDWRGQLAHNNQLHYAALLRRAVWVECGGFRERLWRAEDAEFWARATSFGFRAARVTDQATLLYRLRPDSKGQTEYRTYPDKDGPWTEGFPWNLGTTYQQGLARMALPGQPNAALVPFGAQGASPLHRGHAWNVYHHESPAVSVIIPVGPGHRERVIDALDSLVAQDVGAWEAVVVNDTGEAWDEVPGAPWARVLSTGGTLGAGAARNLGVAAARAPLVLFLDADDWLLPGALRKFLAAYAEGGAAFVYSDFLWLAADGRTSKLERLPDYRQNKLEMQHGVTILIAKAHLEAVGGFDEAMPAWEDWDLACKLSVHGYCGQRIPEGLFMYRLFAGERRTKARGAEITPLGKELAQLLGDRYEGYYMGEKRMAECCPGGGAEILAAKRAIAESWGGVQPGQAPPPAPPAPLTTGITPQQVRMEFIGDQVGAVTYYANGRPYRGGNNPRDRYLDVLAEDAPRLEALGLFRRVALPEPPPPPAPPEEQFPVADRSAVEPVAAPEPEALADAPSPFSGNAAPLPATGDHAANHPLLGTVDVVHKPSGQRFTLREADLHAAIEEHYADVSNLTVKELRATLYDLKARTLRAYLEQEQASATPRKSVVKLLEHELRRREKEAA